MHAKCIVGGSPRVEEARRLRTQAMGVEDSISINMLGQRLLAELCNCNEKSKTT